MFLNSTWWSRYYLDTRKDQAAQNERKPIRAVRKLKALEFTLADNSVPSAPLSQAQFWVWSQAFVDLKWCINHSIIEEVFEGVSTVEPSHHDGHRHWYLFCFPCCGLTAVHACCWVPSEPSMRQYSVSLLCSLCQFSCLLSVCDQPHG